MVITKIQKWGNSQGIRIPKVLLETLKWDQNQQINVEIENGKLVLKKATELDFKTIDELFVDFDGEYEKMDIDWGKPVGEEVW